MERAGEAESADIPERAVSRNFGNLTREAFYKHRSHAKARGIAFLFTYEEWRDWWIVELTRRGPRAKRGVKRHGNWGMCRFLDRGRMHQEMSIVASRSIMPR